MSAQLYRLFICFIVLSLTAGVAACRTVPTPSMALDNPRLQMQNATPWLATLQRQDQLVFAQHDRNQDRFLSPAEIAHVDRKTFQAQDTNQDGRLSQEEVLPTLAEQQARVRYLNQELSLMSESVENPEAELDPLPTPQQLEQFTEELAQAEHSYKQLDRPPVLLVPGYAEPSWYFMYGLYRRLKKEGWQVEGINLFPNFATAEEQAKKIQQRIEDMKARYGVQQVELVVHSFGGLISRYYIQNMDGATSVRNLVTIATPHHGTYTAYLGPGKSADQLKYNSPFIQALNANGYVYEPVQYTSIWSNIDEIVIPPRSAIMPESTVHQVRWTGHLSILFSRRTYTHVLAALRS